MPVEAASSPKYMNSGRERNVGCRDVKEYNVLNFDPPHSLQEFRRFTKEGVNASTRGSNRARTATKMRSKKCTVCRLHEDPARESSIFPLPLFVLALKMNRETIDSGRYSINAPMLSSSLFTFHLIILLFRLFSDDVSDVGGAYKPQIWAAKKCEWNMELSSPI